LGIWQNACLASAKPLSKKSIREFCNQSIWELLIYLSNIRHTVYRHCYKILLSRKAIHVHIHIVLGRTVLEFKLRVSHFLHRCSTI
jgi:hypothetical protein